MRTLSPLVCLQQLLTTIDCASPKLIPSGESSIKPADPDAPIVAVLAAGETMALQALDGTSFSVTAPAAPFISTQRFSEVVNGNSITVELQPILPHGVQTESLLMAFPGIEDGSIAVPLHFSTDHGLPSHAVITALPTPGFLYRIDGPHDAANRADPILSVGEVVNASRAGYWVAYRAPPEVSGDNLATVSFTVVPDEYPDVVSPTATASLSVIGVDDVALPTPGSHVLLEDANPDGVRFNLSYVDFEALTPVAAVVSRLPTKGKLFVADESGALREITTPYASFEIEGTPIIQYLHKITRVSSFWGQPPYAGYHPMTMLGPPDSSTYGEGHSDAPWAFDTSVYPPIGQRVLYPGQDGLVAYVRATNVTRGTVIIEYAKMYKRDAQGSIRQCHIPVASARSYPLDCSFELVPSAGVVTEEVPRAPITGMQAAVWSPLFINYVGSVTTSGAPNDIAYGPEVRCVHVLWHVPMPRHRVGFSERRARASLPLSPDQDPPLRVDLCRAPRSMILPYLSAPQYEWTHNQADYYTGRSGSYTEFFEAEVEEPIYILRVQIGSPRGMGMVTGIHVKHGDEWIALYQRPVLLDVADHYSLTRQYWTWAPEICHTHFKTNKIRIEMDTSGETGVTDWNCAPAAELPVPSPRSQVATCAHGPVTHS